MNCPFKPSSVTTKAFCSLKDWKVCICTFYYSIWGCGYHCRYWSCDNSLDRECTGLTWRMSPVKSDPRVDPHQWHLARQFRDTWPGIQETPGQATPGLATETPGQAAKRHLARWHLAGQLRHLARQHLAGQLRHLARQLRHLPGNWPVMQSCWIWKKRSHSWLLMQVSTIWCTSLSCCFWCCACGSVICCLGIPCALNLMNFCQPDRTFVVDRALNTRYMCLHISALKRSLKCMHAKRRHESVQCLGTQDLITLLIAALPFCPFLIRF